MIWRGGELHGIEKSYDFFFVINHSSCPYNVMSSEMISKVVHLPLNQICAAKNITQTSMSFFIFLFIGYRTFGFWTTINNGISPKNMGHLRP